MRPIYIHCPSEDNAPEVEQITHVIAFWLSQHVAPAWMRSPVPVYYTSNPDAAYEGTILIEAKDADSVALSQQAALNFLNPLGNLTVTDDKDKQYPLDPCKPVKSESYPVSTNAKSYEMSDFVLPAWADPNAKEGELLDYMGVLSKPFTTKRA